MEELGPNNRSYREQDRGSNTKDFPNTGICSDIIRNPPKKVFEHESNKWFNREVAFKVQALK